MAQNALLSAVDSLFVYNPKSVVVNQNNEKAERFLSRLKDVELIHSATVFFYNGRVRLNVTLQTANQSEFALVKGLIEFHRSKNFVFTYNRVENNFEIDIFESEFETLRAFLSNVSSWLSGELNFKRALKSAIAFEARYKEESKTFYQSILK